MKTWYEIEKNWDNNTNNVIFHSQFIVAAENRITFVAHPVMRSLGSINSLKEGSIILFAISVFGR